jgi:uncharacterized protein DUF1194
MRPFRAPAVAGLSAIAFALTTAPLRAAPVDLALVLAVDVSESVDAEEYELQHEGIARAFESASLIAAIRGGKRGAVEVLVLEWSDRDKQVVTVDWTRVADQPSAKDFAAKVRASRRSSNGLTAIGDALAAAYANFARLEDEADRRVIDVSGDGMANIGPSPQAIRDSLVADGVTINGLAILKTEPWLDSYYDQYVVGGPGAFLMQIEDFPSVIAAMQQKLLNEVTASRPVRRAALAPLRIGEVSVADGPMAKSPRRRGRSGKRGSMRRNGRPRIERAALRA